MRLSKVILTIAIIIISANAFSQDSSSADGLFQMARRAAFEEKNYPRAIDLGRRALAIAPRYTDIHVFLGRVFTWNKQYDSAKAIFDHVLNYAPTNEDAYAAYTDLEYWNDHYDAALKIADQGVQHHPASETLLVKKAKVLHALKRDKEAAEVINKALSLNKKNTEARALAGKIKEAVAKNRLGFSYSHTYFDEQFPDPWNMLSLEYSRQSARRSTTFRLNYANRFDKNGLQAEVDAYPRISKTFYSYISAGYSADNSIFPRWRGGFSLYANLPAGFEAEAGTRFLYFSEAKWIYTFSLGKYYKNFFFSARTFLTPSSTNISQSYSLLTRYYYGGADDHIDLTIGTGISPDERASAILLNNGYKLRSARVSAGWKKSFKGLHILGLNGGWTNNEYQLNKKGNQLEAGLSYHRRF